MPFHCHTDKRTRTKKRTIANFRVWICRMHVCVYKNQDKRLISTKNGYFLNESDHPTIDESDKRRFCKWSFISAFTPYWSFPYAKKNIHKLSVSLVCYLCEWIKTNQATRQPSLNGERKRDPESETNWSLFSKNKNGLGCVLWLLRAVTKITKVYIVRPKQFRHCWEMIVRLVCSSHRKLKKTHTHTFIQFWASELLCMCTCVALNRMYTFSWRILQTIFDIRQAANSDWIERRKEPFTYVYMICADILHEVGELKIQMCE